MIIHDITRLIVLLTVKMPERPDFTGLSGIFYSFYVIRSNLLTVRLRAFLKLCVRIQFLLNHISAKANISDLFKIYLDL